MKISLSLENTAAPYKEAKGNLPSSFPSERLDRQTSRQAGNDLYLGAFHHLRLSTCFQPPSITNKAETLTTSRSRAYTQYNPDHKGGLSSRVNLFDVNNLFDVIFF